MDTPSLRQLRTFLAAAETGSVTAAARALHLTQPAASQQLRELERILGVRVFDRAEGRLVPTAAGTALLAPARRTLGAAADVATAASAHRAGDTGRVRVGTGATACIYLLPAMLAAARQRMPGLEIVVATGNTPDILRRVEEGELDVGLVTLPPNIGRALVHERLLRDPLAALLPEGVAQGERPGRPLTPAAMVALPLILFETGGDTRGVVNAWFLAGGQTPRPIMELGSVEAIKVMVANGLGASVLPLLALPDGVPGARILPLRPAAARTIGLVLRREKVLDRGMRVILEEMRRNTPKTV